LRLAPLVRGFLVALSEIDRNLLERCLQGKPRAWEDFVDRFMGLVVHVVTHTAQCRSIRLSPHDRDDLMGEVFLNIIKDDLALMRHFRGQSSLATYLTVIARRIVVRQLLRQKAAPLTDQAVVSQQESAESPADVQERLGNREEVERLLVELQEGEARIVRMYHLEGKSYQEISAAVGMPENSIGPVLSRARSKMRRAGVNQAAG
jgi:RNA polymerase sigma-70 factor, ECF subfamily